MWTPPRMRPGTNWVVTKCPKQLWYIFYAILFFQVQSTPRLTDIYMGLGRHWRSMAEDSAENAGVDRPWSHVFVEWNEMDSLYQPISSSPRIKVRPVVLSCVFCAWNSALFETRHKIQCRIGQLLGLAVLASEVRSGLFESPWHSRHCCCRCHPCGQNQTPCLNGTHKWHPHIRQRPAHVTYKWWGTCASNTFSVLVSFTARWWFLFQYQCIAVSKRYIALGTNTGAIYLFQKDSLKYIDLITTEKVSRIFSSSVLCKQIIV